MVIGGGGWTTNWGADVPSNKGKQISLFRPSMSMTDYRFEFRGQIEKKAIGVDLPCLESEELLRSEAGNRQSPA